MAENKYYLYRGAEEEQLEKKKEAGDINGEDSGG